MGWSSTTSTSVPSVSASATGGAATRRPLSATWVGDCPAPRSVDRTRAGSPIGRARFRIIVVPFPTSLCISTVPVHHLGEPSADGQAEPGAAEAPRRVRLGLDEGPEELLLVLGRDADPGVGHREAHDLHVASTLDEVDPELDMPFHRELDGIAGEVVEDLPQPERIHDQRGAEPSVDGADEEEVLRARRHRVDEIHALHHVGASRRAPGGAPSGRPRSWRRPGCRR